MFRGIVERRVTQRAPFEAEILIRLERDGLELATAVAVDIGAGGLQFSIPLGLATFEPGERIEFQFTLPVLGPTLVKAAICHKNIPPASSVVFYGIKFIDIPIDVWNYILEYTQSHASPHEPPPNAPNPGMSNCPIALKWIQEPQHQVCPISLPVRITIGSQTITGWVKDIGFGGLRLRLMEQLPLHQDIRLELSHEETRLSITGACLWILPIGKENPDYIAGISFAHLSQEEFGQIRTLIFKLTRP